jgi:periplasmic protein TonB
VKLLAVKFVLPLVCSLGVHAALLAVWAAPQEGKRPAQARRPGVVSVTLQHAPVLASMAASGGPESNHPAPPRVKAAQAPAARPVPVEDPADDLAPPAAQMPVQDLAQDAADPAPSLAWTATGERDSFVPRPLLSMPPRAVVPVVVSAPEADIPAGRHSGILSLFIDELGRVRHISADEPLLPPALEQAAREAFMSAQFSPGQVDGVAVRSRQRVEVVFDNTPLPLAISSVPIAIR